MSMRSVTLSSSADFASLSQPATPLRPPTAADAAAPDPTAADGGRTPALVSTAQTPTAGLNLDELARVLGTNGDDLLSQLIRGNLSSLRGSSGVGYGADGTTATLADTVSGGLLYDDYA